MTGEGPLDFDFAGEASGWLSDEHLEEKLTEIANMDNPYMRRDDEDSN